MPTNIMGMCFMAEILLLHVCCYYRLHLSLVQRVTIFYRLLLHKLES
jgi:hypothetical protein